eukprot:scaffold7161_cov109-Isochrysis_galbana.AAC.7
MDPWNCPLTAPCSSSVPPPPRFCGVLKIKKITDIRTSHKLYPHQSCVPITITMTNLPYLPGIGLV